MICPFDEQQCEYPKCLVLGSPSQDSRCAAANSQLHARSQTADPQPPPSPGKARIVDLVMTDLAQRAETGRTKYGTYLYSHNGRSALIDAYQEALDLCMYLRQAIEETS